MTESIHAYAVIVVCFMDWYVEEYSWLWRRAQELVGVKIHWVTSGRCRWSRFILYFTVFIYLARACVVLYGGRLGSSVCLGGLGLLSIWALRLVRIYLSWDLVPGK